MDSFLKAYKASETKDFFHYDWCDSPDKLHSTEMPPYEAFFSKVRNHNPLEKDFIEYQPLVNGRLDQQNALKKLRIQSIPPTGFKNYSYMKTIWEQHNLITFKIFLRR